MLTYSEAISELDLLEAEICMVYDGFFHNPQWDTDNDAMKAYSFNSLATKRLYADTVMLEVMRRLRKLSNQIDALYLQSTAKAEGVKQDET